MLNLTTRTQKWMQMGLTLALGAMLFLSGSAGADNTYPTPEPQNWRVDLTLQRFLSGM
jgi:hypothetical protein